jgi:RNA polymerase sigma factor (TIGR02999 family)
VENTNLRKRILFLAANPKDTIPLRLDEEIREIDAGLRRANNRDNFHLLQKWAVRPRDLRQAMIDVKPHIVHFSGHGSACGGLVLEDALGQSKLIEPVALAGLFSLFAENIECVLLNACYSEAQAEAINDHIKYVIGMNDAIGDKASIEFAIGFYDALGGGESVETAYKFGCNAIKLEGLDDDLIPILKSAPSLSVSRSLEAETPKKWVLVLSATIDEVDKDKAEAIIEHLRQLSEDTSLTMRAKKPGSVKLIIESSATGFDKIKTLIREKKLTHILGLRIEEIRECDDQLEIDVPRTEQGERPNFSLAVAGDSPRRLKAFLCSSPEDKPIVRGLYERLVADGIEPWLDENNLSAGQDWELETIRSVREADTIIACLSPASTSKTGNLKKEIKFVLDAAAVRPQPKPYVISLKLAACDIPERLQPWRWVNLFEYQGYEKLSEALTDSVRQIRESVPNVLEELTVGKNAIFDQVDEKVVPTKGADINTLLLNLKNGNPQAEEYFLSNLYPELLRIARVYVRREESSLILDEEALVNEFFLRLFTSEINYQNMSQFYGIAAGVMRRILVTYARETYRQRRTRLPIEEIREATELKLDMHSQELLDLDQALKKLESIDQMSSRIVELRYFGGLSLQETAEILSLHPIAVERNWRFAKSWLKRELTPEPDL